MVEQADADFRFVDIVAVPVTTTLGKDDRAVVVRGRPVRDLASYREQRICPGWLPLNNTESLVGYESLLERDRLWLADFDSNGARSVLDSGNQAPAEAPRAEASANLSPAKHANLQGDEAS